MTYYDLACAVVGIIGLLMILAMAIANHGDLISLMFEEEENK